MINYNEVPPVAIRELYSQANEFVQLFISDKPPAHTECHFVPPTWAPHPVLTPLTSAETLQKLIRECAVGDAILVGSSTADAVTPFFPVRVHAEDRFTLKEIDAVFKAIKDDGRVAYLKLNPYDVALLERHAAKPIPHRFNGFRWTAPEGTFVDEHIAAFINFSGDHDVARRPEDKNATWEKRLPCNDALEMFFFNGFNLGFAPTPSLLQFSGRGFSPIWQFDSRVPNTEEGKRDIREIAAEFIRRVYPATDPGVYMLINPFIKAPGTVDQKSGRVVVYNAVGDLPVYNPYSDIIRFFRDRPLKPHTAERFARTNAYPENPVQTQARRGGRKIGDRSAPSRLFVQDLMWLFHDWKFDLSGRSNDFFRFFAWHRRNVLYHSLSQTFPTLVQSELTAKVYERMWSDLRNLNRKAGDHLNLKKLQSYIPKKFPKAPLSTAKVAERLGVTSFQAKYLKTILPEDVRSSREAAKHTEVDDRRTTRELKAKEMDEILLSDKALDYTKFTKDQLMARQRKLRQSGIDIPPRPRNKRGRGGQIKCRL